jgi:hypothetical protein
MRDRAFLRIESGSHLWDIVGLHVERQATPTDGRMEPTNQYVQYQTGTLLGRWQFGGMFDAGPGRFGVGLHFEIYRVTLSPGADHSGILTGGEGFEIGPVFAYGLGIRHRVQLFASIAPTALLNVARAGRGGHGSARLDLRVEVAKGFGLWASAGQELYGIKRDMDGTDLDFEVNMSLLQFGVSFANTPPKNRD